ncbi:MAG: hypothetical protein ACJATT_001972 [Myxococcota bacterium]|jgi:hypothetical protein
MHSADNSDVWAPPDPKVDLPVVGDGRELVYDMPDPVFRREARAWLRATRWLSWPPILWTFGMLLPVVGVFWALSLPLPVATSLVVVLLEILLFLMLVRPHRLAARMATRRLGRTGSRLTLDAGSIVLDSSNRLSIPLSQLSEIRERPEVYWLLFENRLAIFVSKSPRIGDVESFLAAVRDVADKPPESLAIAEDGLAQASFRPPSRLLHIARNYAVALRSPLFIVLVVFAAVALVGAFAAMPWQVSQMLVWPLLALSASLILLLFAPALRIAFSGRDALGQPGSVTVWTACEEHLRMDSPRASARIAWADVKRVRRIGRFGLLEMSHGRFILAASDAASGDPIGLIRTIEERLGGASNGG